MTLVKVLLIDDDEDDYILTKDIFNQIPHKKNYALSWVDNYEEGINAMLKSKFDIYLVDYRLGKYTGIDLLNEAIKSNVDDPIIILTGKGDTEVDQKALELGAADYLVKDKINPFTIERAIRYTLKHKQSLKALKESEQKFKIIFDKSRDPFLIVGDEREIKDVNYAAAQLLGYSVEELKQITFDNLCLRAKEYDVFLNKMVDYGAVNDLELRLLTRNQELKTVTVSAFSQIEQHGTKELFYCILHDITDRKQEEKILTIEEITKNIANEINNPLSNINLALEQLSAEIASESESALLYHHIIKSNLDKINLLISGLAKAVSDKDLNLEHIHLSEFLDEFIANAEEKFVGLQFSSEINTDIELDVDVIQISCVLNNLILNAVQARANAVTLKVTKERGYAALEIADNGQGIAQEHQQQIFDPFFTSHNKTFGVGLTSSRKIIQNHGGKMKMKSQWQKGTSFTIFLPL